MHTLCIIQSRLGSSRLPRKALADICGKPMIVRVVERVMKVPFIHVCLAVPDEDAYNYHECFSCFRTGIPIIGGSKENVWDRFSCILTKGVYSIDPEIDVVVRITGDCPLILPDVIERMLHEFMDIYSKQELFFLGNETTRTKFPDGLDVEIFSKKAFFSSPPLSQQEEEHVTLAMKRNLPSYGMYESQCHWPDVKLSVDTQDDLDRVRKIYRYCDGEPPTTEAALCRVVREMKSLNLI